MSLFDANVQETLIGITGTDFIILGANSSISSEGSIAWTARMDKMAVLRPIAAAAAGEIADSDRLAGMLRVYYYIRDFETNVGSDVEYLYLTKPTTKTSGKDQDMDELLKELQINGLTVEEVAIVESLRSRNRLNVCLLIAGMLVDQYGLLQALRYGAHGFSANFLLSVLDQGYREDMIKDEAIDLMKSCFKQLRVSALHRLTGLSSSCCIT